MTEINLMMEFVKYYRNNDYFLYQALNDIQVAYGISEYLNPDSESKFEPRKTVISNLLSPNENEQLKGVGTIVRLNNLKNPDVVKVQELLNYLVPIYLENKATATDKKRRELLLELQKLDEESEYEKNDKFK